DEAVAVDGQVEEREILRRRRFLVFVVAPRRSRAAERSRGRERSEEGTAKNPRSGHPVILPSISPGGLIPSFGPMADPKTTRPLRIETLGATLRQKLENEAGVLDVLVAAMPKGQAPDSLWDELHDAAVRDDRTAELAFAYERLVRDKRMRALTVAQQATVITH